MSLGFSKITIQSIFIIQGIIIGIVGISLGILLGILLSSNINEIVVSLEMLLIPHSLSPDIYHLDVNLSIVLMSDIYKITFISFLMVLLSSIFISKKKLSM